MPMHEISRAAIYARVSTSEQEAANQVLALREWVERRGWDVVEVYMEAESAWKAGHQQALALAVQDARRDRFQVLVVWALDRLSREGPLAILSLVHSLGRYGVKVFSYQEPWTEAPGELGDLLLALAGWVAKMESHRRSERTKSGMARAVAQGKRMGRPLGAKDKRRRRKRVARLAYVEAPM